MESFLHQVAARILADNPDNGKRQLVVFNNHRSELFLHRAFAQISNEGARPTFFMPDTTVIDELVHRLGGLEIVPNEFLLFELYSIHMELGGEERKYKTFEEFISFGDLMMADFSEVDQYRVDAAQLFGNLLDVKAMNEWDVEGSGLTPFQRDYLAFYHSLHDYYRLLRERLAGRGQAYGGMAYRAVADRIGDLTRLMPYDHLYFVGFNALTECERAIIGAFVDEGRGSLIADGDSYYFDDPAQEAGYFLRKHSAQFASLGHYGPSCFGQQQKRITIANCPENVLQCKYAGRVLAAHPDWLSESESTAVVLADESLLIPTLNALPDEGSYRVNISMGFAYADSNVHAIALKVLALCRNQDARGFYHRDLTALLADYYVGRLLGVGNLRGEMERRASRLGQVRYSPADVRQMMDELGIGSHALDFLFGATPPSPDEAISHLRRLAQALADAAVLDENKKEQQALGGLVEMADYLARLQHDYHHISNLASLEKIYSRIAARHSIAFLGKPLEDLQLLGMLETRNLDFRRVILLSANEGVLPAGRGGNTLIPYDLKRHFGLPTYEEKDNIFAYHFYRLIQRAEEVYLLYSSESEAMGKGEPSRFIMQVERELAGKYAGNIELRHVNVEADQHKVAATAGAGVAFTKDAAMMQRLETMAEKGFSPTALNCYCECPAKYYYHYLLGVREEESLGDDLDASQLGEAVHGVLQTVFGRFEGRLVSAAGLREAEAELPALVGAEFDKLFRHGRSDEGRNRFMKEVATSQLRAVLKHERELVESPATRLEIVALERDGLAHTLDANGNHTPWRVTGRVDRIDRLNSLLRIIDYKTGAVGDREIAAPDTLAPGDRIPGKWLQLMCYALIYHSNFHPAEPMASGIYPLRSIGADVKLASWGGTTRIDAATLQRFDQLLTSLVAHLMDPAATLAATPDRHACAHCGARQFCAASMAPAG